MLNSSPHITTIIPTYKRPEKLRKAIESVLYQTYPYFQVCIYDNASGDSTADVVTECINKDPRVFYRSHSQDIGAGENMQFALKQVTTPFFSFLADDDFLLPEFYETTLKGFEKYPDAGCSLGAVIEIEDHGEVIGVPLTRWQDREYFSPPNSLLEMIGKYSNWTGALFRTAAANQLGSLDTSISAIDVDFLFRFAARYPVAISKKPCAVFVHHTSSYSNTHVLELYWPTWLKLITKIHEEKEILPEIKIQLEHMLETDLQRGLFVAAVKCIEKKKFQEAAAAIELFCQQSSSKGKRNFLTTTLTICQRFPFMQRGFSALLGLRRFWKRHIKGFRLQRKYRKLIARARGAVL
ncbi:MAG: glycosyltransferase family 2 protein [Ignavibacteriae bacterium]|nr:glycosyltransferase family 2 protein [Ignavibacteriota bacterium]